MRFFNDLKIGTKLVAGFSLVAVAAGLIGWVGLSGTQEVSNRARTLYASKLVPIRDLGYANAAFLITRTDVRDLFLTKNPAERQENLVAIEAESQKVDKYIADYSKNALTKEEKDTLSKFTASWEQYRRMRDKALNLAVSGQDAAALAILDGEAKQVQAEARKQLRALIDTNASMADQEHLAAEAAAESSRT